MDFFFQSLAMVMPYFKHQPFHLGLLIFACILAYRSPEIIRSIGYCLREGRKNKLEVAYRQKALQLKLEKALSKRKGAEK